MEYVYSLYVPWRLGSFGVQYISSLLDYAYTWQVICLGYPKAPGFLFKHLRTTIFSNCKLGTKMLPHWSSWYLRLTLGRSEPKINHWRKTGVHSTFGWLTSGWLTGTLDLWLRGRRYMRFLPQHHIYQDESSHLDRAFENKCQFVHLRRSVSCVRGNISRGFNQKRFNDRPERFDCETNAPSEEKAEQTTQKRTEGWWFHRMLFFHLRPQKIKYLT